jgi:hypothetical protein
MTAIENARNITYKAARRRDEGLEFPEPESAMAKYYATQIAGDIAREDVIRKENGEWKLASRIIYPDQTVLGTINLSMFL